jgi:hypothetical protein
MTPKRRQPLLLALTLLMVTAHALAASPEVVGHINGQSITLADVETQAHSTLTEREENFQRELAHLTRSHARTSQRIREAALASLIDQRALSLEASATGQEAESLLNGITTPSVDESEVLAYYNAHRNQIEAPFDSVKISIRDGLQKQAHDVAIRDFMTSLRVKYHAVNQLKPLRESVEARGPSRGSKDAAITLIEFADFQCPYCARLAPVLAEVQARYPTQVRLVFRQLPIPQLHPDAERLSDASICADEQQHFWQFHDAIFQAPGRYNAESIIKLATTLGLNAMDFQACMDSGRPTQLLRQEIADADSLALEGTPALFMNGRLLTGALPVDVLITLIDEELARQSLDASGTAH